MTDFPAPPRLHVLHVPGADPRRDATVAKMGREANLCIHPDPERRGAMWNWAQAAACMASEEHCWTWHAIVDDDVDPLPGWQQHFERACRNSPRPVLGLAYVGLQGDKGFKADVPYVVGPYLLAGAAIAYHDSVVAKLAPFAAACARTGYRHDDIAANVYVMSVLGLMPALVTRSLFDVPKIGSLMGHHNLPVPSHTIAKPGPDWSTKPSFIAENRAKYREDEGELMKMVQRDLVS